MRESREGPISGAARAQPQPSTDPPEPTAATATPRAAAAVPDLVPARMLNEFTYCPRLAYLEWVQCEWEDNVETEEGRHAHRRVDKQKGERAVIHDRSIELSSPTLGLIAKFDLLESQGRRARPVDYKRGSKPPVADGAWEPERVQLCAQGLLLREHGYQSNEGVIYYVKSKERVRIRFTKDLVARTTELLAQMRQTLARGQIPPPLEDSPKCPRCSLVRICLPEEIRFLTSGGKIRPLAVADAGTHPLVVQDPRAGVRLAGEELLVEAARTIVARARLGETSQVVLVGGARITTAAMAECCRRAIAIAHLSGGGWLYGLTTGLPHKNVELRMEQFAAARDAHRSLAVARSLVVASIHNARVLLRRNGRPSKDLLSQLAGAARRAEMASDDDRLLGIEGEAGRAYFSAFAGMLEGKSKSAREEVGTFDFDGRNRRPPRDPVNALLSFCYGLLTKDWVVTLTSVGFDPLMGLYHQPRYGKPALALDMMEPFRRVVADSVVVGVINNGEIGRDDFFEQLGGVLMKPAARRKVIEAYERRMALKVTHPLFGYRVTYRRLFELEARLLARHLLGETQEYRAFRIR